MSPFLVDDVLEDLHECSVADLSGEISEGHLRALHLVKFISESLVFMPFIC